MTIKSEIEEIWSEMTNARKNMNMNKLGVQIEAMMDILSGILEETEMNSLKDEMKKLEEKHRKAYAKIDDDTKDYPLMDRDSVRGSRRVRQDVWLLREKYKVITNLIIDKDLVDLK